MKNNKSLHLKLERLDEILNSLSDNHLNPKMIDDTFKFLCEYKNKIKNQIESQKRIPLSKKRDYMRRYRAKRKLKEEFESLED